MAKSVFSKERECCVCGYPYTEEHHIFGASDRPKSEKRGLKLYLCHTHHEEIHRHPMTGLDLELKTMAQEYYEAHYGTRDDFRTEFRHSYL